MPSNYEHLMGRIGALRSRASLPWSQDGAGITRRDTTIAALVHPDAYNDESDRHRVLLIGGLTGSPDDVDAMASVLESYATSRRLRNRIALSVIPCANPDGLNSGEAPGNGSGGNPTEGYPPEGRFFNHETDPEARYLWRYMGFMAPDYVLEVRAADGTRWESSNAPPEIADALDAKPIEDDGGLLSALGSGIPNDLGRIPGIRLNTPAQRSLRAYRRALWAVLDGDSSAVEKSEARKALDSRRQRTPGEAASKLAPHYGDTLDPVIYTQGVAMSGRLRYGALNDSVEQYADGIATVVQPYLAGERPWFGDSDGGANYAGIVWCDEMYEATGDSRYRDLLLSIADKFRGNESGQPPPTLRPGLPH